MILDYKEGYNRREKDILYRNILRWYLMLKKRKISKVIISSILILLFVIGLGLWQPKSKVDTVSNPQILEKFKQALQTKGEIVLNENEVNSILRESMPQNKELGNFAIKDFNIELQEENVICNVFVEYKGLTVFLTTQGQLSYENPFIKYTIDSVKMGKIPIPKSLFFTLLHSIENNNIIVKQETIKIHKTYLPLPLNSLVVEDESIVIKIDLEENLDNLKNSTEKRLQKETEQEIHKTLEVLDKVKEILSKEEQKNTIDNIQNSLEDFMENPQKDISIDQEKIKKLYDSLSLQEKLEIYSSLSSEIDIDELLKRYKE